MVRNHVDVVPWGHGLGVNTAVELGWWLTWWSQRSFATLTILWFSIWWEKNILGGKKGYHADKIVQSPATSVRWSRGLQGPQALSKTINNNYLSNNGYSALIEMADLWGEIPFVTGNLLFCAGGWHHHPGEQCCCGPWEEPDGQRRWCPAQIPAHKHPGTVLGEINSRVPWSYTWEGEGQITASSSF